MADPNLQNSFVDDQGADFSLGVIADGSGPVIVSFIIPDELLDVLAALVRAFISAVRTAKKTRPDAPQVHFLIDEAARMGRFGELAQMFAVDRSAGIIPYLFYQDDGQITRNLGKTGRDTLEANAALMIDLGGGIRDFETTQARSRMLGMQTVEVDDPLTQARAASAAQEIKRKVLFEGFDPVEAGLQLKRLKYEAGPHILGGSAAGRSSKKRRQRRWRICRNIRGEGRFDTSRATARRFEIQAQREGKNHE